MFVASLLGLGIDFEEFKEKLSSISVDERWDIRLEKVSRHSITANLFGVKIDLLHKNHGHDHNHDEQNRLRDERPHNHDEQNRLRDERPHNHGKQNRLGDERPRPHHHRSLPEIIEIIKGAEKLSDSVKERALSVFAKLAEAEAEVHGKDIEAVHFHEVGAVDAIVDICGACLALEMLGIEKIISTPVALGTGTVKTAHGTLPIPVPATVNLLRGIPTENTGIKSELSTPTGAALLATLVDEWCVSPKGTSVMCSYGAGTRDLKEQAAVLRMSLYESKRDTMETLKSAGDSDEVVVMECNIDDMPGEMLSWISPKIMDAGALDFTVIPVTMKKGRQGFILQVICKPDEIAEFADFLLKETTTIGVRYRTEKRIKLNREIRKIDTPWGEVLAKFATDADGKVLKVKPEYESVAKLAEKEGVPYLEMYRRIISELKVFN